MARRTSSRSRSRRPVPWSRASSARQFIVTPLLLLVLLLCLGAVALERAGDLPEPLAALVRVLKEPLDALFQEFGLELPGGPDELRKPPIPEGQSDMAAVLQALSLLSRIPVEAERPLGYEREAWQHWLDVDEDCQDARQEVLATESLQPVRWDKDRCGVVSGLWRDLYTGEPIRDPSRLDIDHMVPLAEAYRSGGREWSRERRAAYANDLRDGRSLIAVSASANRAKGDQGPEDWLPPDPAYWCRYVAEWVEVKVRWSLSMDERERVTAGNLLRQCAEG